MARPKGLHGAIAEALSMAAPPSLAFRSGHADDIPTLLGLYAQLGYPDLAADELRVRLERLRPHGDVLIAEAHDAVVGALVVMTRESFLGGYRAEIESFVVDQAHRGRGVGAALLARAESWARERGCTEVRLHSNVMREHAHRFYLREGYRLLKSQALFQKTLSTLPGA